MTDSRRWNKDNRKGRKQLIWGLLILRPCLGLSNNYFFKKNHQYFFSNQSRVNNRIIAHTNSGDILVAQHRSHELEMPKWTSTLEFWFTFYHLFQLLTFDIKTKINKEINKSVSITTI